MRYPWAAGGSCGSCGWETRVSLSVSRGRVGARVDVVVLGVVVAGLVVEGSKPLLPALVCGGFVVLGYIGSRFCLGRPLVLQCGSVGAVERNEIW